MNNMNIKPVAHSYEPEIFNKQSAEVIVPILLEQFNISSVVDVGCGPATWLAVFRDSGIDDYMGLDSEHVDINSIDIDANHFAVANFENFKPIDRRFDLCISLEVAEHLSEAVADSFVENLTSLADLVMFSSAIPGQTGQHHVNLQWPSYWAEKFKKYGYRCSDFLRSQVWDDSKVNWWYQQNILLFMNDKVDFDKNIGNPISRIHPEQYKKTLERLERFQQASGRPLWEKIKDRLV
jgi:SAM-dependent methyltransferase